MHGKESSWPKFLPYTPVAMGMIQPEWIYMSHFFEDEEEAEAEPVSLVPSPPPTPSPPEIRIHFHSRKS